ncbi:MAG TPA: GIY-YIG nuclease family protein [Tepidisphaeraceae bacterium]|nr:GIY-YIG nuclease family protein [Tepidisphaeraceae bacterium]
MKTFHVYILTNNSGTLYVGVTNDLERRIFEHKVKRADGFTAKYNITRLWYYEAHGDVRHAIAREKEIKGWVRAKKLALVEIMNPRKVDLAAEWFTGDELRAVRRALAVERRGPSLRSG